MTPSTRNAERTAASGRVRRRCTLFLSVVLACSDLACGPTAPGDTGTLPPSVQNPTVIKTSAGALGFYRTVVASLPGPVDTLVATVGILTDEIAALRVPLGSSGIWTLFDSRQQLNAPLAEQLYGLLHRIRGQAQEARGFVRAYLDDSLAPLRGHLFALEGYADVVLADVFCSGIPLSTIDFGADYTIAAGSSRDEVYGTAAALFDSALALTGDSTRLRHFAAVGKGRALLALDSLAAAAAAVTAVPTDFRYEATFTGQTTLATFVSGLSVQPGLPGIGDREGGNGLDYRSSNDPRTPAALQDGQDPFGNVLYFPTKYPLSGPATYVLADGIEARLIEAEAALATGGDWLTILNTLRTDGAYDTQPNAADPSKTDTLRHAGSGGVAGLAPLSDPGAPAARVDLVFRERAFWLYLTGHRQGDLRRLVRQYGRAPNTVYPSGDYPGGNGRYGNDITVPVPLSEQQYNPKYFGCFNRNA